MTGQKRNIAASVTAPIGLTSDYWRNASRTPQVAAFARRAGLNVGADPGSDLLRTLRPFLLPILDDIHRGVVVAGKWVPGGPWPG